MGKTTEKTIEAEVPVITGCGPQRWAMKAKAAGYPLCVDCNEPIARSLWGKSRKCGPCRRLDEDLRHR